MAPGETENNAYANFWGDKQRTLWYVMVFSGVVNRHAIHANVNKPRDENVCHANGSHNVKSIPKRKFC